MNDNISTIETKRIVANPNNPRTRIEDVSDLVASIRENGLMQPIIVRWTKKKDEQGLPTGYEVIAGSRRLTACQQLGIKKVNCIVMTCDDDKAFELATVENLVRENMTPADEARAVAKLFKEGKGRIEVGAIFGKSGKWAEGRRRIANLGEKALKMLNEKKISLGHAEVLCMCDEDRVERWLDSARWQSPEELKRSILSSDRKLLMDANFDVKKTCAKCEKRSDCQRDLFGDITDVYCLDEECFKKQIEKECSRIIKEFQKAGYEAIPEDEVYRAENCYGPYIDAQTEDEKELKIIEELKANGAKAMYWVDTRTAESGLVFVNETTYEADADDDNENMTPELEDVEDWDDRDEIHDIADKAEKSDLEESIEEMLNTIDDDVLLVIANAFCYASKYNNDTCRTEYTFADNISFMHTKENSNDADLIGKDIIGVLATRIAKQASYTDHSYEGLNDWWRKRFKLKSRSEYLAAAKEEWQNKVDVENEDDEDKEPEN